MTDTNDIQVVADIPDNGEWSLITGSHEAAHVLQSVGIDPDDYHGGLFVKTAEAEYEAIYHFGGSVPYLHNSVEKIY
jgi:hypothetical protein